MRYFIIGFKNSGKTTFGRILANRLKLGFLDLDEYIEVKEGMSIPELYSAVGENGFRKLEWKALKEVINRDNIIIATGGGAPCNCDNMNLMEKHGDVIYLEVSNETLLGRLTVASKDRPIVLGKTGDELRQYINDLRNRCEHHYKRAKYVVNGDNMNMEELISALNQNGKSLGSALSPGDKGSSIS